MKERFVAKRYLNILLILLMTLFFTVVAGRLHGLYWDALISIFCVDFIFFVLFVVVLEHNRAGRNISENRETDYKKIWTGFAFTACIMLAGSFLPEFLKPALLTAVLMTAFGSGKISMCVGIFMNTVICLVSGSNMQELALYCLVTLFGCMFGDFLEDKKIGIWHGISIVCLSAILPEIFCYLTYSEVRRDIFFYGLLEGLLVILFLLFCHPSIVAAKKREVSDNLDDILDEMHPLAKELQSFSRTEYQHARRVSETARTCAALVGADEKVCAAAGFYYRIGIMEGSSMVENGIRIAQRECFPEDVIRIISEYNGEQELPSNVESAIVHMVDGLIKKLEVLEEQSMSSEWNQDMIIYQTLNDFSAAGLYDKSGLSMNRFLKIREYLVKEEALL